MGCWKGYSNGRRRSEADCDEVFSIISWSGGFSDMMITLKER